jgi:hypothetical protein
MTGKIKAMRLTKEYNDVISKMPDFDPDVFEDITGIRIKINNR